MYRTTVILMICLAATCCRAREDWSRAQSIDLIPVYRQYIQQHPDSSHAREAQARVAQLIEKWNPALQSAEKCILVMDIQCIFTYEPIRSSDDLGGTTYWEQESFFEQQAKFWLECAGLDVEIPNHPDLRARPTLKIVSNTLIKGRQYDDKPYQFCEAEMCVNLYLRAANDYEGARYFGYHQQCPDTIEGNPYPRRGDAPLDKAVKNSEYSYRLAELMKDAFGKDLLISVRNYQPEARSSRMSFMLRYDPETMSSAKAAAEKVLSEE